MRVAIGYWMPTRPKGEKNNLVRAAFVLLRNAMQMVINRLRTTSYNEKKLKNLHYCLIDKLALRS